MYFCDINKFLLIIIIVIIVSYSFIEIIGVVWQPNSDETMV